MNHFVVWVHSMIVHQNLEKLNDFNIIATAFLNWMVWLLESIKQFFGNLLWHFYNLLSVFICMIMYMGWTIHDSDTVFLSSINIYVMCGQPRFVHSMITVVIILLFPPLIAILLLCLLGINDVKHFHIMRISYKNITKRLT